MAQKAFDFSKPNATFSGCDMTVAMLFPDSKPVHLGDVATLSYSTFRDRAPVRTLGRIGPKGFTKGPRTVAGTIVFTLFDKSAVNRIKEQLEYMRGIGTILPDELPPFDLVVTMANEYGATARLRIYGVAVHEEGMTLSVEDLFTENIWSYQARAIKPLDDPDIREGDNLESSFAFDDSETAGRFVIEDLQGSKESIALRVALDEYRSNQERFMGEAISVGVDFNDLDAQYEPVLQPDVPTFEELTSNVADWKNNGKGIHLAIAILKPDGSPATDQDVPIGYVNYFSTDGTGPLIYQPVYGPFMPGQTQTGYWVTLHPSWIPYSATQVRVSEVPGRWEYTDVVVDVDYKEIETIAGPNGTGIYHAKETITLVPGPSEAANWQIWKYNPTTANGNKVISEDPRSSNIIEEDFEVRVVDPQTNAAKPDQIVQVYVVPLVNGSPDTSRQKKVIEDETDNSGRFYFSIPMKHVESWLNSGFVVIAKYVEDGWFSNTVRDEVWWYFNG